MITFYAYNQSDFALTRDPCNSFRETLVSRPMYARSTRQRLKAHIQMCKPLECAHTGDFKANYKLHLGVGGPGLTAVGTLHLANLQNLNDRSAQNGSS